MSSYWNSFAPNFTRNPQLGFAVEFQRLAAHQRWNANSNHYRREYIQCYGQEFSALYGSGNRLEGWQMMCAEVGSDVIPTSVTQAKKILEKTWVNLVDLMECRATGNPVTTYDSQNALRRYTRDSKKIFPKKAAKENGFLKVLLIHIF